MRSRSPTTEDYRTEGGTTSTEHKHTRLEHALIKAGLGAIGGPLIMRGPEIKRGYVLRANFRLIDIAPTVSHILNMPNPAQCEGSVIIEALAQILKAMYR